MLLRRLLLVLAAAMLVALPAGPALAQEYPPGDEDEIVLDDTFVEPGELITVTVRDFQPGSTITATVTLVDSSTALGSLGTRGFSVRPAAAVAVAPMQSGEVCETGETCTYAVGADTTATFAVRPTVEGTHRVTVTGIGLDGAPKTLSATFIASAAAGDGDDGDDGEAGGLPDTGANTTIIWSGAGLLAAGSILLLLARARRRVSV